MPNQNQFRIKWWWVVLWLVAVGCLVFGYDPVGKGLDNFFGRFMGREASTWAITLVVMCAIACMALLHRPKK